MRTLFAKIRAAQLKYFVHPPNPPACFFLFVLLLALSGKSAKAQLLTYETYASSLRSYVGQSWAAERAEFTQQIRGQRWAYLPNVGLAFGLPSIGLNTGQIASYKQQQGSNAAKVRAIDARYKVLLNDQLNQLRIEVEKAGIEEQKLNSLVIGLGTKRKIFSIYQEAYSKRELKALDYYSQKLSIQSAEQEYALGLQNFRITILEVERLAHYKMPNEEIYFNRGLVADSINSEPASARRKQAQVTQNLTKE